MAAGIFDLIINWLSKERGFGSRVLSGLAGKYTGSNLTPAEEQANQFTAEQAELANERDVFNYQHRYQWQVQDMQKAGLNPALLYGGSSGASSVPSAPAGSSVSPTAGSDPISAIMDLALLKANIENIKADTGLKNAEAGRTGAETERTKMLTQYEIDDIVSNINFRESQISRNEAETSLAFANIALLESDLKTRDAFNAANLKLAEANVAKTEADRDRILQETENLKRDFVLSFAQEALIKAQRGLISQETANALVSNGILKWNEKNAQYEAGLTEYNYNHADGNRIWDRVATGASIFRDGGIGIGAVIGGLAKGAAKGVTETVTNTAQSVYNAKGKLVRTVITNQNRNK